MNEQVRTSLRILTGALSLLVTKQREVGAIFAAITIELEKLAALVGPEIEEAD